MQYKKVNISFLNISGPEMFLQDEYLIDNAAVSRTPFSTRVCWTYYTVNAYDI